MMHRKHAVLEHASGNGEARIDLTPMLDVVFILLIFFTLTATFLRETGITAERSVEANVERRTAGSLLISLDPSDRVLINGRIIDPRALRAYIEQARGAEPDLGIAIEPDAMSTAEALVAIIDAARESGLRDIVILDAR